MSCHWLDQFVWPYRLTLQIYEKRNILVLLFFKISNILTKFVTFRKILLDFSYICIKIATMSQNTNEYLRIIERTRLLCNSSDELGKLVGFSIGSGNGLARMGGKSPFLKDAIFRELAYLVEEDYELDLQQVLNTYIEVDQIIDKYGTILKQNSVPYSLIRYFYGDADMTDDISMIVDKMEGRHIPIIILMILGALPRISSKGGDVKDIENCYKKAFKLLRDTVCTNTPFKVLPALIQMEDEQRRDPSVMNRIHLIYSFNTVLNAYGRLSTRMRLVQTNKELEDAIVFPDIEGLWVEDDVSTVFWRYVKIANGYKLRRYHLNEELKELRYTEFFMKFYDSPDSSWAAILHPKSIEYLLNGRPTPNQYISYVAFDLADDQLTFEPLFEEGRWFNVRKLKRSKHASYLEKILRNDRYIKIDECQEYSYEFIFQLSAITNYHVFIDTPDGHYYKVPKSLNECLESIAINDDVGVIRFGNKTYLAFDSCNLYYDVSTPQKLADLGIEIVDSVTTKE